MKAKRLTLPITLVVLISCINFATSLDAMAGGSNGTDAKRERATEKDPNSRPSKQRGSGDDEQQEGMDLDDDAAEVVADRVETPLTATAIAMTGGDNYNNNGKERDKFEVGQSELEKLPVDVLFEIGKHLDTRADLASLVCSSETLTNKFHAKGNPEDRRRLINLSGSLRTGRYVRELPADRVPEAMKAIGNGRAYRIKDPAGLVPPFILSDVARKPDGSVHEMHHADAVKYCQDRGLRLPTENRTADRQNEVASSLELSALSRAMGNPTADWNSHAPAARRFGT